MPSPTDADIARLKAKFDKLSADKVDEDAKTAARAAASTVADKADADFHQAQQDELTAQALTNTDFADLKADFEALAASLTPAAPTT